MKNLPPKQAARWFIGVASACILIYLFIRNIMPLSRFLTSVLGLFSPLFIGLLLALIINIPMSFVERRCLFRFRRLDRFHRPLAIAAAFFLLFASITGIAFLVLPELIRAVILLIRNVIYYIDLLEHADIVIDWSYIPYGSYLSQINIDWEQLRHTLEQLLAPPDFGNTDIMNQILSMLQTAAGTVIRSVLGLVFSIYILANKEDLKRQVLRLVCAWIPERTGRYLVHVIAVCIRTARQFVVGQTLEAFILGSLCTVGMLVLGLPYAAMIGILVGVTAFLPVVGAYIGAIVGVFMILSVDSFQALIFLIFLMILQQLENNLIYPRVMGSRLHLPGIWVLTAITVGGQLAGPFGMLLGVPAASALYVLLWEATEKREVHLKER